MTPVQQIQGRDPTGERRHPVLVRFNIQALTPNRRGSLLVVTLWLIIVLAMVSVALSRFLSTETRLMRYYLGRGQAHVWASAGVYLGMQRLAQDVDDEDEENPHDWIGDEWAFMRQDEPGADPTVWSVAMPLDGGDARSVGVLTIQITDEERRLDLNEANVDILAALLNNDPALAGAIRDFRDPDEDEGSYEGGDLSAQPPYMPKNAPITSLEELWTIPLLAENEEAMQILEAHGTVHVSAGLVNINTVSEEVFKAIAGGIPVDPTNMDTINRLITSRPGPDAGDPIDDCKATAKDFDIHIELANCATDGNAQLVSNVLGAIETSGYEYNVTSSVFRIHVEVQLEKPSVHYETEAIVRRGEADDAEEGTEEVIQIGGQPFQILAWKEG